MFRNDHRATQFRNTSHFIYGPSKQSQNPLPFEITSNLLIHLGHGNVVLANIHPLMEWNTGQGKPRYAAIYT